MCRSRVGAALFTLAVAAAAPGEAQVDPGGEWRTLHTSHFRIHFRPHYRGVAQLAANEAERAWALLAGELKPPRGTVDLTLSDDADLANGFATPVPSNRLTVLLAPPTSEVSLQHYDSWLRLVIVHELAHVFHLDRAGGLWRRLQTVFGRAPGLFPNSYQPSWLVEGLATYYESRYTTAGRIDGELHTEVLAAQAADSAARTAWDAVSYSRWPAGLTSYAYGSQFLAWAASSDSSLMPRLVDATTGQLIPFRVGRPYRRATGRQLGDDWGRATRPAPATGSRGERLAGGLRQQPVPRVSRDGRYVAYLHDGGRDAPRLHIVALNGWRLERSQRVTGSVGYDWLGDTLVVAQLDFTSRRQVRSDLYSWLPDGRWRRDTYGRRLIQPRAGGGVLAVIALKAGGHQPYIGSTPLRDTAGTTWGAVVPSADGRWVAAARHRGGVWALVRWPIDAPDSLVVLTTSSQLISDPVWDARGALYFVMGAGGAGGGPGGAGVLSQVHVWTDTGPVLLSAVPFGARTPAPLPGGAFLYSTLAGDGWELRRSPLTEARRVTAPAPERFDSAPLVPARETGYAPWPALRPHFWLPLYSDASLTGRFLGATTSGSDAVGRVAYVARALVSTAPLRAQGGIFLASEALGNPGLDLSLSNDWRFVGTSSSGTVVSEHSFDGALGATWVQRRWRSSVSLRLAFEGEGVRFHTDPPVDVTTLCSGCVARDFLGASVGLRAAHVVTAPLAVSAQDGFTWSVVYRRREQLHSRRWSGEMQARLALYARLPASVFAHPVLAARLAAGSTHGPAPLYFGVGGVSSSVLDVGFGVTLGSGRTFPVRGYAPGTMRGRHALTATAELRWPLALVGRSLGHLPAGMDRLWLVAFADAGDAWGGGASSQPRYLFGAGAELAADLRVSYDLPLRVRAGAAYPVEAAAGRGLTAYASLGADF